MNKQEFKINDVRKQEEMYRLQNLLQQNEKIDKETYLIDIQKIYDYGICFGDNMELTQKGINFLSTNIPEYKPRYAIISIVIINNNYQYELPGIVRLIDNGNSIYNYSKVMNTIYLNDTCELHNDNTKLLDYKTNYEFLLHKKKANIHGIIIYGNKNIEEIFDYVYLVDNCFNRIIKRAEEELFNNNNILNADILKFNEFNNEKIYELIRQINKKNII